MPIKDLTGQKFNKLTVLYRAKENTKSGNAKWHCICDCGNECDVVGTSLRSGHTKSCGCNIRIHMSELGKEQGFKNIEDLNGQTFGKLTVIKRVYDSDQHKYKCLCLCECGGEVIVSADKLKSGHTTSCGCLSSKGESIINTYLKQHNYIFKTQVTFEDLKNPKTNRKLRFDFGVYDKDNILKLLIEFNGKQHYLEDVPYYSKEGIERDNLKIEYCKNNNIPLLIIKCDNLDILQTLKEELDKIFDITSYEKYFNDSFKGDKT